MLTTVEYLSLLREYMRKNAAKYGISRMGIFGSVARGEQHEGSDVDICVEIDRPSIFTLVHIKEELEKLLKCPVDLVRLRNNMDELLRGCINKDGIYVYKSDNRIIAKENFPNGGKDISELGNYYFPFFLFIDSIRNGKTREYLYVINSHR